MDEATIARLVLGYLREEGCRGTYKDFLKASRHLQASKFSSSKYVPTRFVGLTLNDILKEYYEIYQTVQGRLEATNYYKEPHSKASLSHQLLYLLNNRGQSSRASTPCFRSPRDSHFGETSPVYTDHVSDVETTPAHKLPGNIQYESEESDVSTISRKKNSSCISDNFHSSSATEKEIVFDTEILAQTLLENKELPEKIAQTINKVAEKKHKFSTELNETIVKKTAEDPIFDQILEEIIGSTTVLDSFRPSETLNTKNTHCHNENLDTNRKKQQKLDSKENGDTSFPETGDKRVEEQNAEAVQSIIERAKTSETQTQQQVVYNGKNDVIVFDGSLDKYILSNACSMSTPIQPPQTPIVLNANGSLLMVPSTIPVPSTISTNIAPTSINQYYILNKPPLLNCYLPPPTVLTEKDILAMPTVIVSDDKPVIKSTKKPKGQQKLQPKSQIEISMNSTLNEFLTLHKRHDEPKKEIKSVTKFDTNKNPNTSEEKESLPNLNASNADSRSVADMSDILKDNKDSKQKASDVPIITPPQKENPKKSTPKSGSHVRNLNFSTPPKISDKKSIQIRLSDKKITNNKKQAVKTLFKKDDKITDIDKKLEENQPWDANLRSFVPKYDKSKTKSPRQRKTTKPKRKNLTKENADFNTTEQDGALLEAALKTPVKSDIKQAIEVTNEKSQVEMKENLSKPSNKECNVLVQNNNEEKKILKDVTGESHKTVLSPSKLNANKRNLVNNTVNENINNDKFLTPELIHDSLMYPIKANKNLIPILETPVKAVIPKTPGLETPIEFNISSLSNFTPVAKMLEANLTGFDINLPTPNIPVTPSFPPFTPTVDLMSPYSNRPTDYSTSSSYYQPSDNEQNKSLEAQLLEVEKNPVCDETRYDVSTTQHLNIFNKNVIGKKNLNLVKRAETACLSSSSSSSSSSDTSEDENESSLTWTEKESNDTVICKKKTTETPRKTYSLRNRSKMSTPKLCMDKETSLIVETHSTKVTKQVKSGSKTPKKVCENKSINAEKQSEEVTNSKKCQDRNDSSTTKNAKVRITTGQESVLKELEEKRQRTINKFKNNEISPTVKQKKSGRFIKIKPIANISNQRRKSRKSDSPKKNITKIESNSLLNTLRKDLTDSDGETEDDISLRLSVSEDEEKILHAAEKKIRNLEKTDKTASDVEAQTLIEGLKERGIHLMHNKNTKIQNSSSKILQNLPESDGKVMSDFESKEETVLNISQDGQKNDGPSLNYSWRDGFDTCLLTDEICIASDESIIENRIIDNNNQKPELENLRARLFIDDIQKEVDIELKLTDFHVLLDINPLRDEEVSNQKTYQESSEKKSVENAESQEMDDGVKQDNEHLNESQSPPSSKKRKYQDDDESAHKEKKCKNLLNSINVDSFLNNIHGNK